MPALPSQENHEFEGTMGYISSSCAKRDWGCSPVVEHFSSMHCIKKVQGSLSCLEYCLPRPVQVVQSTRDDPGKAPWSKSPGFHGSVLCGWKGGSSRQLWSVQSIQAAIITILLAPERGAAGLTAPSSRQLGGKVWRLSRQGQACLAPSSLAYLKGVLTVKTYQH
jgi:hypothetical protein